MDIYIDGVLKATPSLTSDITMTKQSAFKATDLTPGTHVLKGVKMGGTTLTVDAFRVLENTVSIQSPNKKKLTGHNSFKSKQVDLFRMDGKRKRFNPQK